MNYKDYYSTLGVEKDATQDEIKKAYKKMALQCHPDRLANATAEEKDAAEKRFKEVHARPLEAPTCPTC